jgi:hypothetical protein
MRQVGDDYEPDASDVLALTQALVQETLAFLFPFSKVALTGPLPVGCWSGKGEEEMFCYNV